MAIEDLRTVEACSGVHYVDTGMFDTPWYGSVYVLDADRPAVVETGVGADRERIRAAVAAVGIDPEEVAAIVLTHVHLDHAGGAGYLAEAYPNASVYVHEAGARHLVDPSRLAAGTRQAVGDLWEFYADPEPVPRERIVELTDGDAIDLGDRTLTAHHAPGHAPHQVVYRDDRDGAVFPGDAAGLWVPPREELVPTTPPPQFDLDRALTDVEAVRDLDPTVLLYSHFGPVADVDAALTRYRDVLTDWVDHVAALRDELGDDEAVVERVAAETDLGGAWGPRKGPGEMKVNARGALAYLD